MMGFLKLHIYKQITIHITFHIYNNVVGFFFFAYFFLFPPVWKLELDKKMSVFSLLFLDS